MFRKSYVKRRIRQYNHLKQHQKMVVCEMIVWPILLLRSSGQELSWLTRNSKDPPLFPPKIPCFFSSFGCVSLHHCHPCWNPQAPTWTKAHSIQRGNQGPEFKWLSPFPLPKQPPSSFGVVRNNKCQEQWRRPEENSRRRTIMKKLMKK